MENKFKFTVKKIKKQSILTNPYVSKSFLEIQENLNFLKLLKIYKYNLEEKYRSYDLEEFLQLVKKVK